VILSLFRLTPAERAAIERGRTLMRQTRPGLYWGTTIFIVFTQIACAAIWLALVVAAVGDYPASGLVAFLVPVWLLVMWLLLWLLFDALKVWHMRNLLG
jgi:hypothetical protein